MPFGEFLQPLVDGHGFSVAGRQLATARHWGAGVFDRGGWGGMWGLNPRLPEPQSGALPTELIPPQGTSLWYQGGASGANARDNDLARRWSVPPLLRAQQIGEQAIGPGNARRKLAEPRIRGENVDALAVARPDLPAFQRLLAGVLRGEHGLVARIPLGGEVETALLHPTLEILGVDVVGELQQW